MKMKKLQTRFARAVLLAAVVAVLAVALAGYTRGETRPRGAAADTPTPSEAPLTAKQLLGGSAVPTTQECLAAGLFPCYTPAQVRAAYGVQSLIDSGIDGSGQGIVIIDSFGSPTLADDVAAFSNAMGLPTADLQQLYPLGSDFSAYSRSTIAGWAGETTLDAEWAHAFAPGAKITVLVSPVDETEGVQGLPEFRQLVQYALDNHLGSVISQSWSTSENLLADDAGAAERSAWDALYQQANSQGVTIVSAAGDHGPLADRPDETIDTFRSADWPASSPFVTAVGGTMFSANADGSPGSEAVWRSSGSAGGSGISVFYGQPAYQASLPADVQSKLAGARGTVDVSAIASGIITYYASGATRGGGHPDISGGTSGSTPVWAAIIALADQEAGQGLGNINPTLYRLGADGRCFHDITEGSNRINGDPGDAAAPGWDPPTGWGSPDASCLVPALAAAAQRAAS
jgi:subtilase family serine protease